MINSIHYSEIIFNCLKQLNLIQTFNKIAVKHFMTIIMAVFMRGYSGKTINFEACSDYHRTTIAHFLNNGKWDTEKLEDILKSCVVSVIYNEAVISGKPVYCVIDDTIASKTKPSSKALHPIENAYFHHSHLKKTYDYGHQAVSVMLSCNGITLHYAFVMYNKSVSKISIAENIAEELPAAPVISYFLCDCWYTSVTVMKKFLLKGFYTVGAVKTNRVIYPAGIKQQIKEFACHIRKSDNDVSLVTAGGREYYVYRYEGKLNGIENAVILLSYPKEAFGVSKALRAFICTNVSLSTPKIMDIYLNRWNIEVFFRQSKKILAVDKYQIRKSQGIQRYWLLMSLTYYICCMCTGKKSTFKQGYDYFSSKIQQEQIKYIYKCGQNNIPLENVFKSIA